jgi:RNA 3'-terminal phosphate cyclase
MERGSRRGGYAEAYVAAIPSHVAQRELEIVGNMLNWPVEQLHVRGLPNDVGPGNALTITVEHEAVTEVFTGFGEKGVAAEKLRKGRPSASAPILRLPWRLVGIWPISCSCLWSWPVAANSRRCR